MNKYESGLGLMLLAIAFIVLKLTHVINWSWWWVVAPIWAPAAIISIVLLILFLILGAIKLWEKNNEN